MFLMSIIYGAAGRLIPARPTEDRVDAFLTYLTTYALLITYIFLRLFYGLVLKINEYIFAS